MVSTSSPGSSFLGAYAPAPFVFTIAWTGLFLLAWFILNIVIFSLSENYVVNPNDPYPNSMTMSSLLPLEIFGLTGFTTQVIIFLGTHASAGFALHEHTRGARYLAVVFSTMGALGWLLVGQYYYSSYYSNNTWCNMELMSMYCRAAQAVTAFAIAVELGQIVLMLFTWGLLLAPIYRQLQDAADRKIGRAQREYWFHTFPAEATDLNNAYILGEEEKALAGTDAHRANVAWIVRMLCRRTFVLSLLSLFGFAIYALSYVVVSADVSPSTDPVFELVGRSFTILLAFSIATSGYSAFHRKRALTAGALLLAIFTSFSFWSFFISVARRITQLPTTTGLTGVLESSIVEIDAQRGMVIGIGIITVTQSLLVFTLARRYRTFLETKATPRQIELSKNHPYPPFLADGTHRFNSEVGFSNLDKFVKHTLIVQVFFALIWAIIEVVGQSTGGLFDLVTFPPSPYAFPLYSVTAETAFIFTVSNTLIVASYATIFYAIRRLHQGAWLGALRVNAVCLSAWWLLIWPIAIQSAYSDGLVATLFCSFADNVPSVSRTWCDQLKASGTIAIIQGLISFLLTVYCFKHYHAAKLQKDAKYISVSTHQSQIFHAVSMIAKFGLVIWALAAIQEGFQIETWTDFHTGLGVEQIPESVSAGYTILDFMNGNLTPEPAVVTTVSTAPSIFNAVTYGTALAVVVLYGFTTWVNALAMESPFGHASKGARTGSAVLSLFLFFFLFPTFIEACRWINTNPLTAPVDSGVNGAPTDDMSLSDSQLGIAAGIIIMTWGIAFDFICGVWLSMTHQKDDSLDIGLLDDAAHKYRDDPNYGDVEKANSGTKLVA